jgi:hypothetical protein
MAYHSDRPRVPQRTARPQGNTRGTRYLPDRHDHPEDEAEPVESVGLALLVGLDMLAPAKRLAFLLHDMFAVSFDEIPPLTDKSPAARRQLADSGRTWSLSSVG